MSNFISTAEENVMIAPEVLLQAYSEGIFPMADEDGMINWYEANPRAVLGIENFHVPHDLKRILNKNLFEVRFDSCFEQVMRRCAARRPTWISEEVIASYVTLHRMGHAHSVEAWQNGRLVGGLYGVAIGAAFFGESMFHRVPHASKVSLVNLTGRLRERGFLLHDAQIMTPTLRLFGARDIDRYEYMKRLRRALKKRTTF